MTHAHADRIAVISDIHGNIPALEAVLADIRRRGIDRIFCLGDLIGKGPHSDEAVDRIRAACEVVVMGNWDELATKPPAFEDLVWHQEKLGRERIDYLKQMPFSYDFFMSGRLIRLFHASHVSVYKRVHMNDTTEDKLALFHNTERTGGCEDGRMPDVVGYGDIHRTYLQTFNSETLFNVGSVGNPLDITQASYAVLEGAWESRTEDAFSIQMVRVPYDIELAVKHALEAEGMPSREAYINELRTARYRGRS